MIQIRACESSIERDQALQLLDELSAWDSQEAGKLGYAADRVLDFYYEAVRDPLAEFSPPNGLMLLGYAGSDIAGCIGYRQMTPQICELKRLYVRPAQRRSGLGRSLIQTLLKRARQSGYSLIRLETVQFMQTAVRMYESLGFTRCAAYYDIPEEFLPITIFMQKYLNTEAGDGGQQREWPG